MTLSRIAALTLGLTVAFPLAGQAIVLSSMHDAFSITAVSGISDNPVGIQPENECYPANDDFTAPGKILADGDWVVTSEVSFYDFEMVSFAAIATPKDGGCEFFDGKIAVWHEGAFIALIEEAVADQLLIGHIRPSKFGNSIEIRSGATRPEITGYVGFDRAVEELFMSKTP